MTILKTVFSGAAMLVGAGALAAAGAADINDASGGSIDEPAPLLFSWTGFYAGAHAGGGWGDADWRIFDDIGSVSDASTSGAIFGAQIGYNRQLDERWVVGAEASLSWSSVDGQAGEPLEPTFTDYTDLNWVADISGRLGYLLRDRTLLFAKSGLAFGNFDHATRNTVQPLDAEYSRGSTRPGWLIGGGVETALTANWTIRAEYNWIGFRDSKFELVDGLSNSIPSIDDHSVSIVKAGINYIFRRDAEPLK